jgi:hypothetical protein
MPRFLYLDGVMNDVRYLLMYEVLFRFVPVNMALRGAAWLGMDSEKMKYRTNIDNIDNFGDARGGEVVVTSKEKVINNYRSNLYATTKENTVGMEERMRSNIDEFLEHVLKNKKEGQSIVFGFPPYSALYWYGVRQDGTFEKLMRAKAFFIEKCDGASGVRVVDTQDFDEIIDLDNYADTVHYGPHVQALYAEALVDRLHDVSKKTFPIRKNKLENLVLRFVRENGDWLEIF